MKNIRRYLAMGIALGAVTLFGCGKDCTILAKNLPQANGYDVTVQLTDASDARGTIIRVGKLRDEKNMGFGDGDLIIANDYDGDGRVDSVKLIASKGSPLEELASVKKVGEILLAAKEKGKARE